MRREWKGFLERMITSKVPVSDGKDAYGPGGDADVKTVLQF
jgi:hypothetical protein